MNSFLVVKISGNNNRAIRKLIDNNVSLYDINYNYDEMLVKINLDDYKKVKRLLYFSKVKIIKYEGKEGINRHFKNNIYVYIIVLFCFILMDVLTGFIVRIDVIHENSSIRKLVQEELEENKIKKYSLAYDFDEIEDIKNKILNNNRNKLEWMSITRVGMTYVVRIEERIITDITKEEGYRHIVSAKDALITKVISSKGDVLVRSGEYVKKGDILISGELKLYENIKANTLASGEVFGNVWYTTNIKFPLVYEEKKYNDKKRFNMSINNKILFKNKYQYFDQKGIRKIKILMFNITFYKEHEYELKKGIYNSKTAEKLALKKAEDEFNIKLNGKGVIISQKVLKKEENNSTISMSLFVVTNEIISTALYYDIGSDINDPESGN